MRENQKGIAEFRILGALAGKDPDKRDDHRLETDIETKPRANGIDGA